MSEDLQHWVALRLVDGVGPVVFRSLLARFGTPRAVLEASKPELIAAGVGPPLAASIRAFDDWRAVERQFSLLEATGGHLLTCLDSDYPGRLRQIHDPPPFLFVLGDLQRADDLAVGVVGSRSVSPYGRRMAREIARGLAEFGVTTVSGLARGIDAEAHATAVRDGGRTVAVLGSGIDVIYPREHYSLAEAVTSSGALISEQLMGAPPDAENFPSRNRLISGLSLGVVIVEAAERSGSLITARLANEQGREVFVVPGPVGARRAGGHQLIRDGAKLTEGVRDVLEEIAPQLLRGRTGARSYSPSGDEARVLGAIGRETVHVDTIILRSGMAAAEVLPLLLGLEMKGIVEQMPGKFFLARAFDIGVCARQES